MEAEAITVPEMVAIEAVEMVFGVTYARLVSRRRTPQLVNARHVVALVAMELGASSTEVGRALDRDHSTILSGRKRADARARVDSDYASMINAVRDLVSNGLTRALVAVRAADDHPPRVSDVDWGQGRSSHRRLATLQLIIAVEPVIAQYEEVALDTASLGETLNALAVAWHRYDRERRRPA